MKADQLNVLGTSDQFSVLGASTVTNTGPSVLAGDLGLTPGTSVTGFPPGTVGGSTDVNDLLATTGQANALTGYTTLQGLVPTNSGLSTLGTVTLTPGVYDFTSSGLLTGALTLNFNGGNNESFVFQTGSTLTTASGSSVNILDQGTNDSIYWVVGSSATLGTTTAFEGNLIAYTSVTLDTGATIGCGNVVALNGAVTLDSNVIGGSCAVGDPAGTPVPVATTSAVPEPGTFSMLAMGLVGVAGKVRRRFDL